MISLLNRRESEAETDNQDVTIFLEAISLYTNTNLWKICFLNEKQKTKTKKLQKRIFPILPKSCSGWIKRTNKWIHCWQTDKLILIFPWKKSANSVNSSYFPVRNDMENTGHKNFSEDKNYHGPKKNLPQQI